ncbi:hypothetical protein GF314_11195 [bacterium]|nr:hypothetical protein [bacterium]
MPFCPLPATFSDDLATRGPTGVLELGAGEGAFARVLAGHGVEAWTLDRRGPRLGVRPDVVADALAPPFGPTFGVVVAANLLRQVWEDVAATGPVAWRSLLAPGGVIWVLEDEPAEAPPAARNYRDYQRLLARLQPGSRGALLAAERFEAARRRWDWPGRWEQGASENRWPADRDAVVELLASGDPEPGGEVAGLLASIRRSGLSYGRYWWARWQAEDEA